MRKAQWGWALTKCCIQCGVLRLCFLEHARVSALCVQESSLDRVSREPCCYLLSDKHLCLPMWTYAAAFPLKLYHLLNCFPALVIVLPLEVWKTEVFIEKRFLLLYFFLLLGQRKMWHFIIIRENPPFFHIAKLKNRVWLFSRHYLLASYSLQNWKKNGCFGKKPGKFSECNRIRKEIIMVLVKTCKSRRVKKTENVSFWELFLNIHSK